MTSTDIPATWLILGFDEVFSQISISGKKVKSADVLTVGRFPVVDQGRNFISGYLDDANLLVSENKPLIIFGDHTREVKWIDFPFIPGADGVQVLKPHSEMDTRFLYFFLRNLPIESRGYARHFKIVKDAAYLVPPFAEQTRIAAKLEEILAQVDTLKARIDGIPALLKRFRQSVLAAAVSGRLTEEWRGSEEYFIESVMLADLVKNSLVGLVRSAAEQSKDEDQGTPYLKMNNISNNWGVALESLIYVSVSEAENKRYSLKTGDWLFNTRNSQELVGKSCIWRGTDKVFVFNNNILRIRFSDRAVPEFIDIWYRSPLGCEALEKIKSATTSVAAIYQKALMNQIIPLPKKDEQIEIVRRVEQLFTFAERVETGVKAAQARIDRLTQSILAKAFRGELVPQDPNDESASVLVERIKAQSAAAPKAKRTRQAANPN